LALIPNLVEFFFCDKGAKSYSHFSTKTATFLEGKNWGYRELGSAQMRKTLSDTRNSGEYFKKSFSLVRLGAMEKRARTQIRTLFFAKTIGGTLLFFKIFGEKLFWSVSR
jgi:hypothetical protein